jgi:hypothetical protein
MTKMRNFDFENGSTVLFTDLSIWNDVFGSLIYQADDTYITKWVTVQTVFAIITFDPTMSSRDANNPIFVTERPRRLVKIFITYTVLTSISNQCQWWALPFRFYCHTNLILSPCNAIILLMNSVVGSFGDLEKIGTCFTLSRFHFKL